MAIWPSSRMSVLATWEAQGSNFEGPDGPEDHPRTCGAPQGSLCDSKLLVIVIPIWEIICLSGWSLIVPMACCAARQILRPVRTQDDVKWGVDTDVIPKRSEGSCVQRMKSCRCAPWPSPIGLGMASWETLGYSAARRARAPAPHWLHGRFPFGGSGCGGGVVWPGCGGMTDCTSERGAMNGTLG